MTPEWGIPFGLGERQEGVDELAQRLRADRAERKFQIAAQALRDITRCDYRGNEPPEQMIARLALADIDRVR